ncbi:hypothetical protein QVD17_16144 [Tagetes erecta]|uniref:Uncharacterized protein n=1 Tax=Tagetes erecta TaxID=13708 RepID=A0AAD8NZB4_TARER|nr:hypothetical protein QVD17_16144 [Tagetes erecta]
MNQVQPNDSHSVYRQLYALLVYDLYRDPIEAIQMMAIWIWLEKMITMSPDLTRRILTVSPHLINSLGNEALLCWACLGNINLLFSCSFTNFPLTNIVLRKEMPVEFFRLHRDVTINGINEVIKRVCATCLKDIWDGAIARNAQMANNYATTIRPQKVDTQPDERTLFITFSRGFPVAEREVREFFTRLFGECIESFYMQEVAIGEHPLFAKIVLHNAWYVNSVLSGGTKAKFMINGKQVWMRKFMPKR